MLKCGRLTAKIHFDLLNQRFCLECLCDRGSVYLVDLVG